MFSNEELNQMIENNNAQEKEEQNTVEHVINAEENNETKIPQNPQTQQVEELKLAEVKREGNPLFIDLLALTNNNKALDNSEVILAIFEITNNSEFYGISKSNKSRSFWDGLHNVKEFEKILASYKSETLRKYWRLLSEMKNRKQFLDIVRKYSQEIDSTNLKFLTIITTIKDYLSGEISDLAKVLKEAPERNIPKVNYSRARKSSDDESFEIEPKNKSMLKNKRKNPNESLVNEINKNMEVVNTVIESENKPSGKRSSRIKANTSLFTEEDKVVFSEIENIVSTLKSYFPEATEDDLWDALKRNSFNIVNTYLYLSDPELYEGK